MAIKLVEQEIPEPTHEVEEWANDLAQQAHRGEIVSVIFCYVRRDGTWGTGQRGRQNACESVGRLEGLKLDILKNAEV